MLPKKLSMSLGFNYRHLYYFWVVAKEGGISRAAARLDMAVQTVSTQVRELERALGHALLKPAGRGLVLTEAGVAAMRQADQIFQLGEQLPERLREAVSSPGLRLAVGISDGLPKLVVRRLLQPVLPEPMLRLLCHEDEFDGLLADLALHRLDVVLADRRSAGPSEPQGLQPCAGFVAAVLVCPGAAVGAGATRLSAVVGAECRCCCPPRTRRCATASTSGSSGWDCARGWPVSSRTARCWSPSARPAWACSPLPT